MWVVVEEGSLWEACQIDLEDTATWPIDRRIGIPAEDTKEAALRLAAEFNAEGK